MAKRRKREQKEAEVPISSMIDIVFLLIIFFVVTASIDKEVEDEMISLAAAPHGKPVAKKDPRSVVINIRKDGTVNINMIPVSKQEISRQLIIAASKFGTKIPIIIRADKDVQHGFVKKVMEAVKDTQLYRVRFDAEIK